MKRIILLVAICLASVGCMTQDNEYQITGLEGGDKTVTVQTLGVNYIINNKSNDWELIECNWISKEHNNILDHSRVFVYLAKRVMPWKTNCGYIWFDSNGRMVKDETRGHWKKQVGIIFN